jgi:phospholipid N-methyltransferase
MDLANDIHIVEFGAGSGTFTDALLKKLTVGSQLSIFEIDPLFIKKLQIKYKSDDRVVVYSV